jgi:hypothetical protein
MKSLRDAIDALAAASSENRRIQRFAKGLKEPLDRFAEYLQRVVAADDMLRSVTSERDAAAEAVLRAAAAQRATAMASQTAALGTMLADIDAASLDADVSWRDRRWRAAGFADRPQHPRPIGRLTQVMRERWNVGRCHSLWKTTRQLGEMAGQSACSGTMSAEIQLTHEVRSSAA